MSQTKLVQIVTYTDLAVKQCIEKDIKESPVRLTISSCVDRILKQHYRKKKTAA